MDIVIITKNRPSYLTRLLWHLAKHPAYNAERIIVIDDSPDEITIRENAAVISKFPTERVEHICKFRWAKIAAQIIQNRSWKSFLAIDDCFRLGDAQWNTPAARNVAQLITLFGEHAKRVLWLDDDVVLDAKSECEIVSLAPLEFISLRGCPDYGRLTWLKWFFALKSSDFQDRCLQSGMWSSVPNNEARHQHVDALKTYTELGKDFCGVEETPFLFSLPSNCGHGAAFCSSLSLSVCPLFPPFYGEDQYWMTRLQSEGIRSGRWTSSVLHDGARKVILDLERFCTEEKGALCAAAVLLLATASFPRSELVLSGLVRARVYQLRVWRSIFEKSSIPEECVGIKYRSLDTIDAVIDSLGEQDWHPHGAQRIDSFRECQFKWEDVRDTSERQDLFAIC